MKNWTLYSLTIIFITLLVVILYQNYRFKKDLIAEQAKVQISIQALNDTLRIIKEDNQTVYEDMAVITDINNIMSSPDFSLLSKERQDYYKNLSKLNNVLADMQAQISFISKKVNEGNYGQGVKIVGDSIKVKKGTVLSDTSIAQSYKLYQSLTLSNNPIWSHKLEMNLKLRTSWEEREGKVYARFYSEDPDFKVDYIDSYFPQKTVKKKNWVIGVGPGLGFSNDGTFKPSLNVSLNYKLLEF